MRDIIFLVADGEMEATVQGFFENEAYHQRLQCAQFDFDPKKDLIKHPKKDPGVYQDGHHYLKLYRETHRFAVVMLDFAFNDNLQNKDYQEFCQEIHQKMLGAGWPQDSFVVMVINPELEVLMWQSNTQGIEHIVDYQGPQGGLKTWLEHQGLWPADSPKPPDPKAAIDKVRGKNWGRRKTHSQIYKRVAKEVSFRNCQDASFLGLWEQIKQWYPV